MQERIPYVKYQSYLNQEKDTLVVKKRGGGERKIKPGMWWIFKGTGIGEDGEIYERKAYDGRRYIPYDSIIAVEKKG